MSTEPISVIADLRFLQKSEINPCFKESLEVAISLLESMGKDSEMLDAVERWGDGKKWVARQSTRYEGFRLHNISGEKWRDYVSFDTAREAITTAMKKEA